MHSGLVTKEYLEGKFSRLKWYIAVMLVAQGAFFAAIKFFN